MTLSLIQVSVDEDKPGDHSLMLTELEKHTGSFKRRAVLYIIVLPPLRRLHTIYTHTLRALREKNEVIVFLQPWGGTSCSLSLIHHLARLFSHIMPNNYWVIGQNFEKQNSTNDVIPSFPDGSTLDRSTWVSHELWNLANSRKQISLFLWSMQSPLTMVTFKETCATIIALHKEGFTGKDIAACKITPK